MNLGYIVLYVRDMSKAKAFYMELLGAEFLEKDSSPTFISLRPTGGSLIGLQDKATSRLAPARETESGSVELSFEVDDVDHTWKHWKEKGVELLTEPVDLPFGRYFLAKDPEGNYLSIYRFNQPPAITAS